MASLYEILFLDIETVPQQETYNQLTKEWRELWDHKAAYLVRNKETETFETVYNKAGIYAEFGKVVCITCGYVYEENGARKLNLKSFYGEDEKVLLAEFCGMLKEKWEKGHIKYLCAHNGKEFDFPFLCRRLVINNMPIPALLDIRGKKPWESQYLDTMDMWRFGDYKNYTSMDLLARVLDIPSPKEQFDGSMVFKAYLNKELDGIANYCQKDVEAMVRVYLRLHSEKTIDNVVIK